MRGRDEASPTLGSSHAPYLAPAHKADATLQGQEAEHHRANTLARWPHPSRGPIPPNEIWSAPT